MKQHYLIGIFMAATILTACTDEEQSISTPQDGVLRATIEGNKVSSRAGFVPKDQTNAGAFYWSKGDKIGVTTDQAGTQFSQMTLTEGIGQSSGSFNGTINGNIQGYAVYPYNENHSINGNTLTYYLKPEYTYTTVDADFATEQLGQGNSFNPAMYGRISNGNVAFKHLGAVCCIKIPTLPTGSNCKLNLISDKKISGSYTTDLSATEPAPAITATTTSTDAEKTVTITFSNSTENTSGVFYVPVPTGEHTLRLKVIDGDQKDVINAALGTFTFTRRLLKELALNNGTISGGETKEVTSAGDIESALTSSDIVAVTGEISGTATVEIPASASAGSNKPKNVILEKVAENATLTVTDNTTGGSTSVKELSLSFAANETTTDIKNAPSVTITTPQTTTTLAAVSGTLKLKEVTASTAENTLIVGTGVTINALKVVKGNVRVNKGAVINTITNQLTGNAKVTIIKETGAQLPDNLDDGKFNVVDAAMADLEEIAKNGGSYTLTQNLILSSPLNVQGPAMTLDLNGHSIKPKTGGLDKILNTLDALILVRRGASLTINDSEGGGSVDCNGESTVYAAVKLTDTNDGTSGSVAKLVVNGGTFTGYYAGICGNGTRHNTDITINGGTITSAQGPGIYHPQSGKLTISGGEISGLTGIEIRAGELVVNGGKIKGTASIFEKGPNGNGNTIIGAAVAVSQHTTNLALKATITGASVLDALYALYEEDLQNDESTDQISLAVSGGTLNGKVYSENCTSFITGGTFSDPSVLAYLGTNANVNVVLNASSTCKGFVTESGQTVELDLNGHELTLADPTVGSTNTKTNSCQLLQGSTVTFKNGTLKSDNTKIMIQNYCNLTLDAMTVTATKAQYVSSNNCGNILIKNTTINAGENGYAFDVCGFSSYTAGVSVTVKGSSVINGKVELSKSTGNNEPMALNIEGGTFNGNLVVDQSITNASSIIHVSGTPTFTGTGWNSYINSNN